MKASNNSTSREFTKTINKNITLGDFMKTINKMSSLISVFIIGGLIGTFIFLYTSKVADFLNFMHDNLKEEAYFFEYSKMYVAIYIFASLFIFLSIVSFLANIDNAQNNKKLLQLVIFYINLISILTVIILLLVVYLKNYHILSIISSNEEMNDNVFELLDIEFTFYGKLFIFLLLQGVSNIILSILSLKNLNDNQIENEKAEGSSSNQIENKQTEEIQTHQKENISSEKALILKEIEEMKATLELQELKNEYMDLYKKLNKEKEK